MIVTVTPNTTLDQTVILPNFIKGSTVRAKLTVYSMGGKPTDASFILGELGIPSLALGMGAGAIRQKIEALLHGRGVTTDFVTVNGESRLNVIVVDESDGTATTITTSTLDVESQHVAELMDRYVSALRQASCVVMGGTMPRGMSPSFYTDAIIVAHQQGIPVVFDASEPYLSPGLDARPDYIKPNRDELAALVGYPIDSLQSAYRAGQKVIERFGVKPIITMGADGALAMLDNHAYVIPPLKVKVVSPAGAGDAVLAGLAAALSRKQPIEEGLRLGFAAATAVLLMPGTADCRREDVDRFLPQIQLIPYSGE